MTAAMVKQTARCGDCGRRTSVTAAGTLHKHRHPGWGSPCPGRAAPTVPGCRCGGGYCAGHSAYQPDQAKRGAR